ERSPDLELETLDSIRGLFLDRRAVAELQRAHWRDPRQAQTGRRAQAVGRDALALAPDVAGVGEGEDAQRLVVARARHREVQLGVEVQAAGAADVGTGGVDHAERA